MMQAESRPTVPFGVGVGDEEEEGKGEWWGRAIV